MVHAYIDYRKNVMLADSSLETIGRFCISEIERDVDTADPAKVKSVLQRIVNLSGLSSIEIREGIDNRMLFSFGEKDKREILRKVFSLELRNGSGRLNSSAVLIVYKDISFLQYRAWKEGFYDFLGMMVFVAVLSAVCFLLLKNNFVLGFIGISRDITGRRAIENEFKEVQKRFKAAFDTCPMMIMILDHASEKLLDVNLRCIEKTGYTKTQLLSCKLADIVFWTDADGTGKLLKVAATDVDEIPVMIRTKSGNKIDCLLAGRRATFSEGSCLLIFLDDISLRKQAEETMRRSMKMDAVGQVTGGIAHDFNNILGIIIGNLDFIKRFCTTEDHILQRVEAAAKASGRAAMLTRQLLDFSRQHAGNCEPTDINEVIQGMDNLIARSVTPEVEVVTDLYPELWIADIDRGDFENVLLNLVINARDAMPEGGKLQIITCNTVLDDNYILMNPVLKPGEYILLSVRDSGVGIPPDVLEHIFEPFFTTKPQGKGTGLGMSMVYAFSQRSRGSVRVYSETGVGTTVHIYLPRTKERIEESRRGAGLLPGLPGGDETILIVDDEPDLVTLANDMLRILGYRTLAAKNGNEAVNILLDKNNAIDLLFTDVVMPGGINGFELAQQALLLNPDLKVLFTSGYIEKAVPKSGQFPFTPEILLKPYNELDLAIRIRDILDDD